ARPSAGVRRTIRAGIPATSGCCRRAGTSSEPRPCGQSAHPPFLSAPGLACIVPRRFAAAHTRGPVRMHAVKQYFLEDLEVGMRADYAREVTEEMIECFAEVSGDFNPLHLDEAYARETVFK